MQLEAFQQVPFENEESFRGFLTANYVDHASIISALNRMGKVISYPVSDSPGLFLHDWLYEHFEAHREIARLLNLAIPTNLCDFDFMDKKQWFDWQKEHYNAHVAINNALGLN